MQKVHLVAFQDVWDAFCSEVVEHPVQTGCAWKKCAKLRKDPVSRNVGLN